MTFSTTDRSNALRALFHKPTVRSIGGVNFTVYKLAFDQFDDALEGAAPFIEKEFSMDVLVSAFKADSPAREPLLRTIAGCLKLENEDSRLTVDDIAQMPIAMIGEAVLEIMEVNADFFIQTLPNLVKTAGRIASIGLKLPSYLSEQVTSAIALPDTPSPKSADSLTPSENTKPSESSEPLSPETSSAA